MKQDLTETTKNILKKYKGFITANNYKIIKVEENYCELEGIITDTSTNHLGTVHGGYIFGLADSAAGIAAMTDGRIAVTLSANINYIKAANTSKLKAIAKCIKNSKKISFFEIDVYDEEENIIAQSNINYYYIEK